MPRPAHLLPALGLASLLLATGCDLVNMKWRSDVTFTLDRDRVAVGQAVAVRFSQLDGARGHRYGAALVPEETGEVPPAEQTPLPAGTRSVALRAQVAGPSEVRVYVNGPGYPNLVIARRKLTVTP